MMCLNYKYKIFESGINDIIKKCVEFKIDKYDIDDDGLLTVYGDVDLQDKLIYEIPIKFKEVHGDFDISNNNITSLFGSPLVVKGSFYASYTKIKNLKHSPVEVGLDFDCGTNKNLINIRYFPQYVGKNVILWNCNKLKSLYGCLKFLNGTIDIYGCCALNTLKYAPSKVLGSCRCASCGLKSLYGAPKSVGHIFTCSFNKLSSLKYSPRYIGGDFSFRHNNISSFDYFPDYVGGEIYCNDNPVSSLWRMFENMNYINYFNQLKIISTDGKKINIKRLNVFLNSIDKDTVKSVERYENI